MRLFAAKKSQRILSECALTIRPPGQDLQTTDVRAGVLTLSNKIVLRNRGGGVGDRIANTVYAGCWAFYPG